MKRLTLISLFSAFLLIGCSSKPDVVPDIPPSQLYAEAQNEMSGANWISAVKKLEALDSRYPFGAYSQQVQLDLIYVYYKKGDLALSSAAISRFMRQNPTSDQMDWVLYMQGLVYVQQNESVILDAFNMDPAKRDPRPYRQAFTTFKKLVQRYPESGFSADAKARLVELKDKLARYEYMTADFYFRRGAYLAAANRGQNVVKFFSDTQAARDVLPIMLESYQFLKLEAQIAQVRTLMKLNAVN